MGKAAQPALLQGTLDLLVLHALQRGAMHGYAIAQTIHLLSEEVLKVEEGSRNPACRRTTGRPSSTRSPGTDRSFSPSRRPRGRASLPRFPVSLRGNSRC